MKLSKNFTLEELTMTSYPTLQDAPSQEVVMNLVWLAAAVLQPLRDFLGEPVSITSGYRSKKLNEKVGGVKTSYHLKGLAADIVVKSEADARRKFDYIKGLPMVDAVLFEHKGRSRWLHVQVRRLEDNRRKSNWNFVV